MTAPFLLSLAVKGTAVLALGASVAALLRRSPASLRHCVWAATFAGLLAVPVLGAFGPSWRVAVLPDAAPTPPMAPAFEGRGALADGQGAERARPGATRARGGRPGGATAWLGGLWALGALAVGLQWLRAFALGRRLVRASRPVSDPAWSARLRTAAQASGLERPVRLRRSEALRVPVAWGWGRPTVVLPARSDAWDAERAGAVLLHEFAHLRRRDAWTQAVAQAALALHWPNPLAWAAYRHFLCTREQACDDAVLEVGAPPAAYASHLVAIARELVPPRSATAALTPLVGPDDLETRVGSILDGGRRRGRVGRRAAGATLALAMAVVGPLAAFQPVAGGPPGAPHQPPIVARATLTASGGTPSGPSGTPSGRAAATSGRVQGAQSAPVGDGARRDTVDTDTARVRREAAAVEREAAAVEREAARVRRRGHAAEREAARVRREAAAVERERAAVGREAARVRREAAAVEREAARAVREAARVLRETRLADDSTRVE